MSRTLLIVLATPVVLLILAALLIPLLLDEEELLAIAADTLEEQTGAILRVDGGVDFSIFPNVALELGDASITMPGEQTMSLKVASLGIGLELMPLFSRKLEIGDIAIDGLVITVQSAPELPALDTSTLTDEQLDAFYQKRREVLKSATQVAGQDSIAALPLALNVGKLAVVNSRLELLSADRKETTTVNIVALEVRGLNLDDKSMPISLRLQLPGEAGAPPIAIDLQGDIKVNAGSRQLTVENLEVAVRGVMAQTVTLKASGVLEMMNQVADLNIELALGELRGDGSLRYASFETPQINAKLHLNKFDPALLALAGPDAAAAAQRNSTAEKEGVAGDQALPLDAIRAIDTRAVLLIDEANFAGHAVKNMTVKLRVVDGVAKLNALTGTVHGGKLDMKATFNAKHNTAKLNSMGSVKGLDIAQALNAMDSEPLATGTADLQWRLGSSGTTPNQLIEAMRGPIDLQTQAVTLQDLGIEKMLCEAVALANRESMVAQLPERTEFVTLSVKLRMNEGKLQMKPLRAELSKVSLRGEGALDLLKGDFRMNFEARLAPDMGELDPACRVNDRLTAIAWPVKCKGNLDGDPSNWCGVDSQKIIEDLATKEVQHQLQKEGSKLLDRLLKR